ncbi:MULTISPECIES: NAD-dependent epimerase/dehydratase family protein [Pseudomonas]|uniref:NAD(P)-dependent oxidoreductase n=1 Tax=Pseudomonas entomophila TaxID=312306 RepID=A0A3Q8U137_9PSED|nr:MULTISPECIES: NAD(P)-dependent oxidoreductase [Pseudomonas]AZL68670.1 NAD(P)-dependent oxidoreductase [Pseudomonas oryziphila]UVL91818.1 NAD(P)-dependent oxidoreductase [Pseudomonas sichuanensis]
MKVLVTGGTGFIGRHLVWHLAAQGWQVLFSGRNAQAAAEVIDHSPAQVSWLALAHGSAQTAGQLTEASQGCDAIVHCAALSSPWGSAQAFRDANLEATAEVIQACQANGIARLVHLSTPSLYFDYRDRLGIREDQPLPAPVNQYARTKAQAEALLALAELPACVILRPRAVFGPWDATLMPRLLRVMRRGAIPLMRGGQAQLDLTCVDNLVHAVWLALTRPLPRPLCVYNLSNGTPLPFNALLAQMAEQFQLPLRTRRLPWPLVHGVAHLLELKARLGDGREPLITRYGAGVLAFSQTLDIGAIERELGYRQVLSQAEGIARYAQWWRARQGGAQ